MNSNGVFVFPDPQLQFAFTGPGPSLYLPDTAHNLYLPALDPQFVTCN